MGKLGGACVLPWPSETAAELGTNALMQNQMLAWAGRWVLTGRAARGVTPVPRLLGVSLHPHGVAQFVSLKRTLAAVYSSGEKHSKCLSRASGGRRASSCERWCF